MESAANKYRAAMGKVLAMVSVEPMLLLYVAPSVLASLAMQNLNLEKACRVNLAFNATVCDALTRRDIGPYKQQEEAVQQLVASVMGWRSMVQSALPSAMLLFLGAWSDRHGRRKPLMLLPVLGELLASLGLMLNVYFEDLPVEVAALTESIFPSITGGWFTSFMAVFSHIGDVTSPEDRTLRIGVVNLCVSLSIPIGMSVSGILLKAAGLYGVLATSSCLYVASLVYGYFRIHDKPREPQEKADVVAKTGCCWWLSDFLDYRHVLNTFRVAFRQGDGKRRCRVILLMLCCCVIIGPMHGEMAVMYLFTRYRFNWDEVQFSIFTTYSMLIGLAGTAISVGVFSKWLKVDDALIGVYSCMSKILSCFIYAFSYTTWMIYLAPIAEILNGTSFIAMRSIISKLVPSHELGQVNSVFGVCEAMMPLAYAPMYTKMYRATMESMPGAFFLLGGALTAPAVLIFLWMYTVHRRLSKNEAAAKAACPSKLTNMDETKFGSPKLPVNGVSSEATNPVKKNGLIEQQKTSGEIMGVDNPAYTEDEVKLSHKK